jgi:hypothetical protein
MTWMKPKVEFVDVGSETTPAPAGSSPQWIKPDFEFVDLCTEVTLYLYHH